MAKSKQEEPLKKHIKAAKELNKKLGLEPAIPTKDVSDEELIAQLRTASELIEPADNITKKTSKVLDDLPADPAEAEAEDEELDDDEFFEDDEFEEEDAEEEDAEEEEIVDGSGEPIPLDELRDEVKSTKKRADLIEIVKTDELFESLVKKINKYRTAKALRSTMVKMIDAEIEVFEEAEDDEPKEAAKSKAAKKETKKSKPKKAKEAKETKSPKKDKKAKKASSGSSREFIEKLIAEGEFTRDEIIEKTSEKFDVKTSTIRTHITDGKNPKYNKFSQLVQESDEGILSFDE